MKIRRRANRKTLDWYKGFLTRMDKLDSRLTSLQESIMGPSAGIVRVAFDFARINAELFKKEGFFIISGSTLYRNAQVGIVFCAAGMESALSIVLAMLCLNAQPRVQRQLLLEQVTRWRNNETIRALRKFHLQLSILDNPLLQEVFETRNSILHARPEYWENHQRQIAESGRPRRVTRWVRGLSLAVSEDSRWVTRLPLYLTYAIDLLEALETAKNAPTTRGLPKMRDDHPLKTIRDLETSLSKKKKKRA